MFAPVTHILPLATIRRERSLPAPGRVVVRKGQKVSATDVVAEGTLYSEHMVLDIARGLGLPAEEADRRLQYRAGDLVSEGSLLAGPVGLAKRVVRAPGAGRILQAGGGQVLLELRSEPFGLKAGLPGTVIELVGERGAIIETTGALVQGVWGNGLLDAGPLAVLLAAPGDALAADRLDTRLSGSVLLAGYCGEAGILERATELPVRGLILASLAPSLVHQAARQPYPIVILEGFGRRLLNSAAYGLLTTSERQDVAVNAAAWNRYAGTRPEVVIPLPAEGAPVQLQEILSFSPGQTVRLLRAPYAGKIGTLSAVLPGPVALPSGLLASTASIRLESGETVLAPLANIEVLA